MTPGFAALRLYLDEDVDVLLASLLAVHGMDCLTPAQTGHLGWTDEAHLEYATQEARVLITHNRVHFENLAVAWWGAQRDHAGIVLAIRRAGTYDWLVTSFRFWASTIKPAGAIKSCMPESWHMAIELCRGFFWSASC
jgi:hypothetical protein